MKAWTQCQSGYYYLRNKTLSYNQLGILSCVPDWSLADPRYTNDPFEKEWFGMGHD